MNFLRKHGGLAAVALILLGTLIATATYTEAKDLRQWSTTAGSNNDASPDGFPEGMAPSGVNNSARELMASVAEVYATTYGRNALINGEFRVAQRGTSFTSSTSPANSDDTYLLDRWNLLSDGNNIVNVAQETSTVPTGAYAAAKFTIQTTNKAFGIVQILEARDSAKFKSGTASLSFQYRITGSSLSAVRAGVLCWTSTADSVTSDVVSAWPAAGTNPTLVANWAFQNTPAALTAPTTSYQTARIENTSISASCNNIAVMIWLDDVTTTGSDILYIGDVQLEPGPVATNFERLPYQEQLARAQRYTFQWTNGGSQNNAMGVCALNSTTNCRFFIPFPVPLRTTPTLSVSAVANFDVEAAASSATSNITLSASTGTNPSGAILNVTVSGLTSGQAGVLFADANEWLRFDSEL